MNSILRRRRGMMGVKKEIPPTKLTEGSYTRGTSIWSVDSTGKVIIDTYSMGSANGPIMPVDTPFEIKIGDEIVLYLLRKSGSPGWHGTDVKLRSAITNILTMGENLTWNWSNNSCSVTKVSDVNGTVASIYMYNRGNTVASSANYSFALKITVNGKVVLE